MATQTPHELKTKLLNAALNAIRAKGYAATTIDDICREAGVTKGSFFHHFKGKDDLALSAVSHWGTTTEAFFASAPYRRSSDPLEACSDMSIFAWRFCKANCLTTLACSEPWFRKPTPRIPTSCGL